MKVRFLLSLAALLAGLAGCSELVEAPLSPEATRPAAVLSASEIDVTGVLEFATLPDLTGKRSVSQLIRASEGGSVELHGFRVDIPAGALPQDTVITIDLPRDEVLGKRVIAEFGPHGIQFEQPVTLTFPLEGVLWLGDPIEVGRWENDAWTSLGGTVSADGKSLSSTTPHFSAYGAKLVAAGG